MGMASSNSTNDLDVQSVRSEFPLLSRQVHGKPLIYLDSAATTPKPQAVLDAVNEYNTVCTANVHRAVHELSNEATDRYEHARKHVASFINAPSHEELIWTSGTTASMNLFSHSWGRSHLKAGDHVLVSAMEHHANIVPWQLLRDAIGIELDVAPITDEGTLTLEAVLDAITDRTKLISMTWISNVLGSVNPVAEICAAARERGITTIIDGAQALPHATVDVQAIGCDAIAFSGHKMYGPTGIGALWARREMLETMPPWQGGGDMIKTVTFEASTWNDLPWKFEAGTPNIAGAIGMGAAANWIAMTGRDAIAAHEHALLERCVERLTAIDRVRLIGTSPGKAAVVSFLLDGLHPHDVGTFLDQHGIAVRTGHHCAWPLMQRFDIPATVRASMGAYNSIDELDRFGDALERIIEVFG
jgi:cysteine desulfurase/selenocysteine lyase